MPEVNEILDDLENNGLAIDDNNALHVAFKRLKKAVSNNDLQVKDYITGKLFNLDQVYYNTIHVVDRVREDGIFTVRREYTMEDIGNLTMGVFYNNKNNINSVVNVVFRSQLDLEHFCKKYNYIEGINLRGHFFHKSNLSWDRKRPNYFNNTRSKTTIYDYLNGLFSINDHKKRTEEYKDLLEKVRETNEKYGIESKTYLAFEGIRHTFGVEIETISGSLENNNEVLDLNFQSVFDGSLRDTDENGNQLAEDPWGAEYVTGVLKGDSGLDHLHKIISVLSKECKVDKRCATHVHIGSLKWNSEDIVFAWILAKMLEKEIFEMMPKSRANNIYCKMLPEIPSKFIRNLKSDFTKDEYKKNIKDIYSFIFNEVGKKGKPSANYNKLTSHPQGRHGGYNRDRDHRYSWLNFTNIIFNQRGSLESKTLEFRPHSGTLSYRKIHNWIKICMGFVEFVNNNKNSIINAIKQNKNITLQDVIFSAYPKTGHRLNKYVELRKDLFSNNTNENHDYTHEAIDIKNLKELICV